jgi:uncharacterized protein YndB with AHSA1/START domain
MSGYPTHHVSFTRVIAAPRDRVFKAWTNPTDLAKWWGPDGFTNPRCEFDTRPGGKIHIDMHGPNGVVYPMTGEVREVIPNERLVFVAQAVDQDGTVQLETLTTVTFEDADVGKTKLTVKASGAAKIEIGVPMIKGMEAGWSQSLERLDASVTNA